VNEENKGVEMIVTPNVRENEDPTLRQQGIEE
jgi:hypothetical protein